jgi:TatD DNase family protein
VLQACNREGAKILSVHSVRSITLVLDMIEKYIDRGKVRVVLHWFTGSTSKARRATQLGCYFSINEQMATSPRSAKVVASLPAIVCSPKQMAHSQAL